MAEPGFRIDNVRYGTPFRPRSVFAGYLGFANAEGAVLLEPAIAGDLRAAASRALPHETGGLLSGRTLRDGDGTYVVVSDFVEAQSSAGSLASFRISPQETEDLRERAFSAHPTADVVGWWHSHPRPSHYSGTDLATQATWTQRESVGLLVFPAGEEWGIAYLGPGSQRLDPVGHARRPLARPPLARTAQASIPAAAAPGAAGAPAAASGSGQQRVPDQPHPAARPGEGWPLRGRPRLPRGQRQGWRLTQRFWAGAVLMVPLITGAVVVLAVLIAVHALSREVGTGFHRLSGQFSADQHQFADGFGHTAAGRPGRPAVSWSCIQQSAATYSCAARLWGFTGSVVWRLDGATVSQGLHAVLRPGAGPHVVSVMVTSAAGTFSAGSVSVR